MVNPMYNISFTYIRKEIIHITFVDSSEGLKSMLKGTINSFCTNQADDLSNKILDNKFVIAHFYTLYS